MGVGVCWLRCFMFATHQVGGNLGWVVLAAVSASPVVCTHPHTAQQANLQWLTVTLTPPRHPPAILLPLLTPTPCRCRQCAARRAHVPCRRSVQVGAREGGHLLVCSHDDACMSAGSGVLG